MRNENATKIIGKLFREIEKTTMLKKEIAQKAGLHPNTLRGILERDSGDINSVAQIADVLGYDLIIVKKGRLQ